MTTACACNLEYFFKQQHEQHGDSLENQNKKLRNYKEEAFLLLLFLCNMDFIFCLN